MKDNIGVSGVDSLRLGGRRIEDLPIAESIRAQMQLPAVHEADRESKIAAIKARYPKGSVLYYNSRIKEAQGNIVNVQNHRMELQTKMAEYTAHVTMCEYRDKEAANILETDPDREEKLKDLRKRFPPYDVKAMRLQIEQFDEGCQRCDDVITAENASIAELSEAIGRCKQRDMELKNLGAS